MTKKSPQFYAITYLLILIPLFGLFYYFLPISSFGGSLAFSMDSIITCLYYSTVTITTLGYGDISANSNIAQLLVISETILGVITIGLFLNSLSIKHSTEITKKEKEKEQKEKFKNECDKILRHNKIIEQNIEYYLTYTKEVTTPYSFENESFAINRNFTINDMKHMFLPSSIMTDNFQEPVIKYYYRHQNILEQSIRNLLLDINFAYWIELEQECIEFLKNCKIYDYSESILASPNIIVGADKMTEFYSKGLETYDGDLEFKKSNIFNQFIALHKLINSNCEFIKKYQLKINEIKINCA